MLANPWLRLLLLVLGLFGLGYVLQRLAEPLTPFAVAFAVAYFLNPGVNALERVLARALRPVPRLQRWLSPRSAAVGLLCGIALLGLLLLLAVVVPKAYQQVADAARRLPQYAETLRAKIQPLIHRLDVKYPEQSEEFRRRLEETIKAHLPELLGPLTRGVQAAFSSVLGFVLTVLNLVIVPIFAVYLLYDMNAIRDGLKELVPHRARPYVFSRLSEVDRLLSAFARGQVTVCLMLGAFYAVGLSACGVPMGIPVGLLIGFFNLIPFMSYVAGLPLALLLSWVDDQDPTRLLIVAIVFTVGQFVEGNFITPRIVGESVGLHAVVVMLAVLVGGSLFGVVGMLLAMPVTAALSVFWSDLRELYLKSDFFSRGASEP